MRVRCAGAMTAIAVTVCGFQAVWMQGAAAARTLSTGVIVSRSVVPGPFLIDEVHQRVFSGT
jgi:hypothetical protein